MRGRVVLPVVQQIMNLPEGKPIDFVKSPSGSGGDVAVNERPVRYAVTGVASPEFALFRPETSRTAAKR